MRNRGTKTKRKSWHRKKDSAKKGTVFLYTLKKKKKKSMFQMKTNTFPLTHVLKEVCRVLICCNSL